MSRREAMERELLLHAERERRRRLDGAIGSLADFIRLVWEYAEPGRPLLWSWHIPVVCDELERVFRGDIESLVLAQPPRTMKSYLVNVFFPAWAWLRAPALQFLCVSNSDDLSIRDSRRMRNIVTSPTYADLLARWTQRTGEPGWELSKDQRAKTNFTNTRGGGRECVPIRGTVTGRGCDYLLLDDVYDAKEAVKGDPVRIGERMAEAVNTHDTVLLSRFNPGGPKRKICIMQRLHDADLAGVLIGRGEPSLVLPMEYEPREADPRDRRTTPGEVLVPPEWLPRPLPEWKAALGHQASGQLQQRPMPPTGGLFQAGAVLWLDRARWPSKFKVQAQGWDLAMGAQDGASYTAGFVGGLWEGRVYVCAGYHGLWEIQGQTAAISRARKEHPEARRTWIEDRANAKAAISLLRRDLPGLIPVQPDGDKVARAQAWAPYVDAGNVVLPCRCGAEGLHRHPDINASPGEPWAVETVREMVSFPRGELRDRVDALGYLVRGLLERASSGGVTLSEGESAA